MVSSAPASMTTSSLMPGTTFPLQLAAVCQELLLPPPSQVTVAAETTPAHPSPSSTRKPGTRTWIRRIADGTKAAAFFDGENEVRSFIEGCDHTDSAAAGYSTKVPLARLA